jgi:pimeloyl-ACP methyl ester carboxylesterase
MFYRAYNGTLRENGVETSYIRFGTGKKTLVMLPGVSDGLKTVRGAAVPFALLYRALARDFTVYVFSRRNDLPAHFTTRQMADDLAAAMRALGLADACVLGVSQGGMIAQYLAIDHPELVKKLALAVTLSRPNETAARVIGDWTAMARRGDYKGIMLDTAKRYYSPKYLRRQLPFYRILGSVGKPKSFDRFLTQAESCLQHDAYELLPRIGCPTLIIGGMDDRIVSAKASEEIAARIPDSTLILYPGLGHGLYEEAKDFFPRVASFFS